MYQIYQNDRPTTHYFHSRQQAQSYANLENMGSDMSTFSVRSTDLLPSEILYSEKNVTIHS